MGGDQLARQDASTENPRKDMPMKDLDNDSSSATVAVDWERRPELSCVICSLPRSGSNLLSYALEDAGLVGRPREYFGSRNEAGYVAEWGLPPRYSLRSFLQKLAANTMTPNGVLAVKIHQFDFRNLIDRSRGEFGEMLGERELAETCFPNPRYIFIRRADRARQAISFLRAADSEQWERLPGDPVSERTTRPQINLDEVDQWVRVFGEMESKWREFFARNNLTTYEVVYEDLVDDYPAKVQGALDYLGLTPPTGLQPPAPRLQRQADDLTESTVVAYMNRVPGKATASDAGNQAESAAAWITATESRQAKGSQAAAEINTPEEMFRELNRMLERQVAPLADITARYLFKLSGHGGGDFHVLVKDGHGSAGAGTIDDPDLTVMLAVEDFLPMVRGDLNAEFAYMTGRVAMRGDETLGPPLASVWSV
jgi:trehalose 2-sulfotransferase